VLIVDTMPYEDSYKKNHIPGAKQFLFPIPDMKEWDAKQTDGKSIDDFKALLGPDLSRTIVIYCGFVKCTRSHNGAVWARKLGYTNVFRHPGGIFAWKGADIRSIPSSDRYGMPPGRGNPLQRWSLALPRPLPIPIIPPDSSPTRSAAGGGRRLQVTCVNH